MRQRQFCQTTLALVTSGSWVFFPFALPLILDANGEAFDRNHFVDAGPADDDKATRDEALRMAADIANIPAFRSGGAAQVASDGSAMTLYTACRSAHRSLVCAASRWRAKFSAK